MTPPLPPPLANESMAKGREFVFVEQITLFWRAATPIPDPADAPAPPTLMLLTLALPSGEAAVVDALELEHELEGECRK